MMYTVGATAQLQKALDTLHFKCWYYEQAVRDEMKTVFPAYGRRRSGGLMKMRTAWMRKTEKPESKLLALRTFSSF